MSAHTASQVIKRAKRPPAVNKGETWTLFNEAHRAFFMKRGKAPRVSKVSVRP